MALDRAAILLDVFRRNAIPRQAWLPPLHIRAEFDRAIVIAIDGEVRASAQRLEHRAVLSHNVEEVRAEMLTKHGIPSSRPRHPPS